jgi:uncharacterized protein
MSSELPERVDPFRLCDQARSFEGRVNLADLPRLAEALASTEGQASYRIACDRDEQRRARIRGSVEAELTVICQRCMRPMRLPVHVEFQLALVSGESQVAQLPDDYDPLLLEGEETLRLADVIEDELLLALPVAPLHPIDECSVKPADWSPPESEPETDSKRENPFAVLAGLKRPEKDD